MNENWKKVFLLLVVLGIAVFFRTFSLKTTPPGLYPDEAMNGNNALEAIKTNNFKIFYPENNGREGLFINIQAFFLKTIGLNEPWVLRLPSAFFGIFTVLGVFLLTKELFKKNNRKIGWGENELIALSASFLIATSFWHINFSRIGFRAIMAPFFLTWAIYFLLKAFDKTKKIKSFFIFATIAGIFYGLGFYSYIAYRITPLLILLIFYLWWNHSRDKVLKTISVFVPITTLVVLPLLLFFINYPENFLGRTSQLSVFSSGHPLKDLSLNILKTAGMFNVSGDYNWRHNIAGEPLLFFPVGILFVLGIIFGIKELMSKNKYSEEIKIIFAWFILMAIPVVISNEGIPHALRAIIMIPPVFIISGFGAIKIFKLILKKGFDKKFVFGALFLLFICIIFQTYNSYFIRWGKNPEVTGAFSENYVNIGRMINYLPAEINKYIIVEAGGVDVRGLPMSTQTTMFITNSFLRADQKNKNIFYVFENQRELLSKESFVTTLK